MPKHSKRLKKTRIHTVNLYFTAEEHAELSATKSEAGCTWNDLVLIGAGVVAKAAAKRKKR